MALIKCPDCENSVSDQAETCRHCGRPIRNTVTVRASIDEVELDLFDAEETEALKKQILLNENKLGLSREAARAKQREKKKRENFQKIVRTILFMAAAGVAFYFFKRR